VRGAGVSNERPRIGPSRAQSLQEQQQRRLGNLREQQGALWGHF
jgi:hypothetical protein